MKFTPEVIAALQTLKDAAENDSEKIAVANLENELKHFNGEIWRDVIGYEGFYQVSNYGRIKSFKGKTERLLTVDTKNHAYAKVLLSKNGCGKTLLVHRIVAKTFIPNPENKPEVNHKNGNKYDNRVENLEWMTCSENTKHAFDTGLAKVLRGTNNGNSKLTSEQITEIRTTYIRGDKNFGIRSLAKKFNVSEHTISRIVHLETFKDSM